MPLLIDWNIGSPQDLLNKLRLIVSYNSEFKALPRKQRAMYAAIRGELIECVQEESDDLMAQCQIYLRIIELSCDLEDWQLAKNFILSNAHEKQTISEEISILGFYEDKCRLYESLIRKINSHFDCFLWGEIGSAYNKMGDTNNAIKFHEKQLRIAQNIFNYDEIISAYNGLANIYNYSKKDAKKALDYAQKSGEMAEKSNIENYKKNIDTFMGLGQAYNNLFKFRKSIIFIKKALSIAENNKDSYMVSECLVQLGSVYGEMQNLKLALEVLLQQSEVLIRLKYRRLQAICFYNLSMVEAELYGHKSKTVLQKSINYALQALEISKKTKDKILQNICYNLLGAMYLRKNEYEKGLEYLQKIEIGYLGHRFDCKVLSNLCVAYGCQKNFYFAMEYAKQAVAISTTIQNKEEKEYVNFCISVAIASVYWNQEKFLKSIVCLINAFCVFPPWKNADARFVFRLACTKIRELLTSHFLTKVQ